MFFCIYPIVPYAPAFLHSFLLLVTVVKGIGPKTSVIFLLLGTGIVLVFFYIYPIVPHAPVFLHSSCNEISGRLSKDVSVDKVVEKEPVKRQSSMRYTKPILERSRTISMSTTHDNEKSCTTSTSVMHDLGDGEEVNGDNITLMPNQGMIYLSGHIGRRVFKRLIPFKMALASGNRTIPFDVNTSLKKIDTH